LNSDPSGSGFLRIKEIFGSLLIAVDRRRKSEMASSRMSQIEVVTRCLMEKSQKGRANVATPGRLLDSNGKRTSAPIKRHARINKLVITFTNIR
jgi:hypothetical protein